LTLLVLVKVELVVEEVLLELLEVVAVVVLVVDEVCLLSQLLNLVEILI
jgi:hypothetical protein